MNKFINKWTYIISFTIILSLGYCLCLLPLYMVVEYFTTIPDTVFIVLMVVGTLRILDGTIEQYEQ